MNKSTCEYLSLDSICTKGSSNISINKLNDCNGIYPLYGASGFVKDIDFFHQEKPYIGIVKDGAGVGRVSIYPAKSSLVGTMQYIIPSSKCTINYLYHFLCSLNLSKFVSGATIPHIYFKDYGKCLIPIPTIEEQGMIASELDMITEMISKYDEQLKELDKLSQSIFYEMFGDPVENEKGWEVKIISDVSTYFNGVAHEQDIDDDGEFTLINSKFISTNGKVQKRTNKQHFPLLKNDLTMVLSDVPNGKALAKCYLVNEDNKYSLNQRICCFRGYEGAPLFFKYVVNRHQYFLSFNDGKGQTNLRKGDVEKMPIILPPLPLQQSFARKIEAIEAMKSKVREAKKEAETLLAARMQYWFE